MMEDKLTVRIDPFSTVFSPPFINWHHGDGR